METKQVIVIRKDLKMRRGKEIAQACHASMSFLTKESECDAFKLGRDWMSYSVVLKLDEDKEFFEEVQDWLENSFKKIVVCVNSEAELDELHQKAIDKGLESHMVIDNGLTEFNGVPTKTCLAIGPHESSRFEGITDHLPLY